MLPKALLVRGLAGFVLCAVLSHPSRADELRNIKQNSPVPAYRMPAIDGKVVTNEGLEDTILVLVCVSAEQRRSEKAALDSFKAWKALDNDRVQLVHITADIIQKSYFEGFRQEHGLTVPLAFDVDRAFFGKLGLIVLPTTIIIDAEGKLSHVISLHSSSYEQTLDAYIRHTLGEFTNEELQEHLAVGASNRKTPKSRASAHRALARSMRQKGMPDIARGELIKAREQDPESHDIILDLADLDITLGDLDNANELVDRVLHNQPNHRRAQLLKGIVHFQREQYDDAKSILNKALELNPNPERVHYYLARIYESDGQTKKALAHYHEALRGFLQEPN